MEIEDTAGYFDLFFFVFMPFLYCFLKSRYYLFRLFDYFGVHWRTFEVNEDFLFCLVMLCVFLPVIHTFLWFRLCGKRLGMSL